MYLLISRHIFMSLLSSAAPLKRLIDGKLAAPMELFNRQRSTSLCNSLQFIYLLDRCSEPFSRIFHLYGYGKHNGGRKPSNVRGKLATIRAALVANLPNTPKIPCSKVYCKSAILIYQHIIINIETFWYTVQETTERLCHYDH